MAVLREVVARRLLDRRCQAIVVTIINQAIVGMVDIAKARPFVAAVAKPELMPLLLYPVSRRVRPVRVRLVNGVVPAEAVEVDAPPVADGVPVDELARAGVVVAVRQAQQPRLRVRVVPVLAPELRRVLATGRARRSRRRC